MKLELTGIRTKTGQVCVGSNKRGYLFYDPDRGRTITYSPKELFTLIQSDHNTCAILANALRDLLQAKGADSHDLGAVATQCVGQCLYLYEAGPHGGLYPRYYWRLPFYLSYPECLLACLRMELVTKELVADKDTRESIQLPWANPLPSLRMGDSWDQYAADIIASRNVSPDSPLFEISTIR